MPNAKILIVEDNPIVAEDIKNKLAHRGYTSITTANSAKQALAAAGQQVPDIALMDIHLGDEMDGIDTAMELKNKYQVPAIYITAFADEDTVERAKITEPYGYIVKPLDEQELCSTLEIALYKQQSHRSIRESRTWLETTLKCIGDGVIATDTNGKVVYINAVAEALTGWDQATAVGRPLDEVFEVVHEDTSATVENPVIQILKEQHVVGLPEPSLLVSRNGKKIPIANSGAPIRGDREEVIGVVLVFRDQTDERMSRRLVDMRLGLIEYAISHSLDALLKKALDDVGELVDSPIGFYHFVSSDQKSLSLQQWSTRTLNEFCKTEGHGLHYDVNEAGVWTDCVGAKKPIIHNNYASLPHKKGLPEGHAEVTRELLVPVLREDKVVAILGVGNKPTDYTEKDSDIVSYMADVTWEVISQKRAEQALRNNEERYRGVVEDTPVLICRFNSDGEITFVNKAYCEYFSRTPETLINSKFLSLIPEDDREIVWNNIQALTLDSPTQIHEHQVVTATGEIRWQRWTNRALFDGGGMLFGYQSIGEDITDHKRTEQELKKSLVEWQSTFDAVNAAIWILDKNQRIVRSNSNVEYIFDKPYHDLIGQHCWDVFHSTQKPLPQCPLPLARKSLHRETMEIKMEKGWFEIAVDPILDEAGNFNGAVHIVTDITKRKQSELEKEKLHAQLIQSQKMESVGRLAGGVAHDFNNMLSVIMGHAELAMEEAPPSSALHQDLTEIVKAAQRSADLTRQLLAFARKQTVIPKVLDLNDAVTGTLKMLRRLIGEDIDLIWKPGAELWSVMIDPAQIDQVLANLCVNGRDAISGVGKISIETQKAVLDDAYCADHPGSRPGDYVMLAVSDNGHGIDEAIRDNIFEPFFTTKAAGRGTGLGLATVYGIVKQNDGFINVNSEQGLGATFKIYLPRTQEIEKEVEDSVEVSELHGTETVLLVEDEETILKLAEKVLTNFGYTVLCAQSPEEAIELARHHADEIQLMITDVVMPVMNGLELKEKVTQILPSIKIIFMSGYTSDVVIHHGILEGEVHYLPKPFTVRGLGSMVRDVLDNG